MCDINMDAPCLVRNLQLNTCNCCGILFAVSDLHLNCLELGETWMCPVNLENNLQQNKSGNYCKLIIEAGSCFGPSSFIFSRFHIVEFHASMIGATT